MITIVIPVKDRAALVGRTLESVRQQTLRPLHVILVDNGSVDGTHQVLRQWQADNSADDFHIQVIDEPRPGATVARNTGLAAVTTEWTMFFDSDDTMVPVHAATALAAAQAHPDADIIGWDVMMHTAEGREVVKPFYTKSMLYNCVMHGGLATLRYMARTDLFRRAGGWNPSVCYWNDIEFGTRMLRLTPSPVIYKCSAPRPLVDIYFTEQSITGGNFSQRAAYALHSLDCMERNVSASNRWMVDMRRAILAGKCRLEQRSIDLPVDPQEIMTKMLAGVPSAWQRLVLRMVYHYTALGLRGAARVFRPLMPR